jgi:hypothetical protein
VAGAFRMSTSSKPEHRKWHSTFGWPSVDDLVSRLGWMLQCVLSGCKEIVAQCASELQAPESERDFKELPLLKFVGPVLLDGKVGDDCVVKVLVRVHACATTVTLRLYV